jgi:hypothetical protein
MPKPEWIEHESQTPSYAAWRIWIPNRVTLERYTRGDDVVFRLIFQPWFHYKVIAKNIDDDAAKQLALKLLHEKATGAVQQIERAMASPVNSQTPTLK